MFVKILVNMYVDLLVGVFRSGPGVVYQVCEVVECYRESLVWAYYITSGFR